MEPETLKSRLAQLDQALAAVDISTGMHASVREKFGVTLDGIAGDAERDLYPHVKESGDPDLRDGVARLYRQLAITNSWLDGREARSREWIDRAAELAATDVLRDLVVTEQNRLRDGEAFAGIAALCQQGLVDKARRTLVARRKASSDPVMQKRIDEILADPRNLMAPLRSAPPMFTMNGFGTMLYGSRNQKADGTYVATLCLVFIFLPILPIRSFLVQADGAGYRFFGRVPLSPFAFWYRRLAIVIPTVIALFFWGADALTSLPYLRESGGIAAAEQKLAARNFIGALGALADMRDVSDAERAAKLDQLATKAITLSVGDIHVLADAEEFLRGPGAVVIRLNRPLSKESSEAIEAAFARIASLPTPGKVSRDFLAWMSQVSPDFLSRQPQLAAKAASGSDDPELMANAAVLFTQARKPCPPELLSRLRTALLERRHATWPIDALAYLNAAEPADARPVLDARIEAAWKGLERGTELQTLKGLPEPCRTLLRLEGEASPEKQAAELEKAAEAAGLQEPHQTWHRLGSARRLAKAYARLHELDPIRTPASKVRTWAILAAELDPKDGPTRVTAMRYLVEEGDFARAIAMGKAAAGDPKADILTGIALARTGKSEDAAALLRPIVAREMPGFSAALQAWEQAVQNKTRHLWKSLELGTADRSVITRLNALPKESVGAEADKWIRGEISRDFNIQQLDKKWRERLDVHPAASELAMIELSLGRALPTGPERQARFQASEKLFLDLRKINPEDSAQELLLGQVYFWLGKDQEGTEIFDRIEANGDGPALHQLGEVYRGFSRYEAARRVLEKAYDKAAPNRKSDVAMTRSLATFDQEDKLAWLKKCDASTGRIKAELDQTGAEVDMAAGKYAEAVAPLQRVAEYYKSLAETSMSLNNGSVVQQELARATGDLKYLTQAQAMMRRAHEISPEDPIVLGNYVSDLGTLAYSALAGTALRADLLHELPDWSWMEYAVPPLSAQEWAVRAKAQAELRRAAELGAKSVILSPDSQTGYQAQISFLTLTRDGTGLRRLRESLEANPPRRAEDLTQDLAHNHGDYTDSERKDTERNVLRWEQLLPQIRKAGHAPTLGHALIRSVSSRLLALKTGVANQKLEAMVREIEEAVAVFPSPPVRESLAWIRQEQAARALAAADVDFASWMKDNATVPSAMLIPLYARKHPDRAAAMRNRAEIKTATQAVLATVGIFGEPLIQNWAWLEFDGHESRTAAKKAIRDDAILSELCRVKLLLNRGSAGDLVKAWLAATALEDQALADAIAEDARQIGVFPLFFKP